MITIDAEFYPKKIVGYESFEEAVSAGISSPQAGRARDDSKLIEGQRVVEACWDEDRVAFLLSGGSSLYIFVSNHFPEWSIGDTAAYASLRERMPSPQSLFTISYVTDGGVSNLMDEDRFSPAEITQKCLDKTVLRIALDPTALYLQFRGTSGWHVFFMPVKRHDNGEPILVWVEDWD